MINAHTNKQSLNRVTAVFADGSQSFLLPKDATLLHIADRIDDLGTRHERPAIAVVVKLAPTPLQGSAPKLPDTFRDGLLAELPGLRAFAKSMAHNPDPGRRSCTRNTCQSLGSPQQVKGRHEPESLALFTILRNTYIGELRSRRSRSVQQRRIPYRPAHQPAGATSPRRAPTRCPRL